MLSAYFDHNIYNDLDEARIPSDQASGLRALLTSGRISVRLSLPNIEELLGLWERDRAAAIRKLRLARSLIGFVGLLKQPGDLVRDAIQAYADGTPATSPALAWGMRRHRSSARGNGKWKHQIPRKGVQNRCGHSSVERELQGEDATGQRQSNRRGAHRAPLST